MKYIINSILCSFSQIMLQKNRVTGLFFAVGILINSPLMLAGGIISVLTSINIAMFFKYDSDSIQGGVYGFSPALVGIATLHFFTPSLFSLALLILGSIIATVTLHFINVKIPKVSVFTAPFVISTWFILIIVNMIGVETAVTPISINSFDSFYAIPIGVAQVFFQDYWLSGVIFIVGLLFNSYRVAAWAIIASGLAVLTAQYFEFPANSTLMGIYGFNAILTAIALAERYKKKQWLIFIAIVMAVLLTRFFEQFMFPLLTVPFILTSWLIIVSVNLSTHIKPVLKRYSTYCNRLK